MNISTLEEMTDQDLGDYMASLLQQVSERLNENQPREIQWIHSEINDALNEWEYRNQCA